MLINNDFKLSIEQNFLRTWNSSQPILTSDTFKTPPTQHKPLPVIIHPSHSPYTPPTHHKPLGGAPSHTLFGSRGASPYKDQQPARGPWRCLSPSSHPGGLNSLRQNKQLTAPSPPLITLPLACVLLSWMTLCVAVAEAETESVCSTRWAALHHLDVGPAIMFPPLNDNDVWLRLPLMKQLVG